MIELFHYDFFIHALLAAILASVCCGIIGSYIVCRRIVFISGGITHASFGGIGLGFYLEIHPLLGAAAFAILTALCIELFSKKAEVREDSMIGILWAFGMAIGIIFVDLTPGYAPNLINYLFGNILTVSHLDLYLMGALVVIILAIFGTLFKEILYISFDEEYAKTQGVPTRAINCVLICLVALTIVIVIRVAGIILVISLLTIPQAIAGLFSKNFKTIIFYSIGFCFLASMVGLFASYKLDIPSGACIIFISVIMFVAVDITKRLYLKIVIGRNLGRNP